jgi:hypothetical protein
MIWAVEHLHRDGSVLARHIVHASSEGFRIGRALDNDLVLDDPHCAAYHAKLEIDADGSARLIDLDTQNGIVGASKKRLTTHVVGNEQPYRIGQSLIRVRSSAWPLAAEQKLTRIAIWPLGLLGLALVLADGAWDVWLTHVQDTPPEYLYRLSGVAAGICVWSATYTLFGRLVSGMNRFFSHLAIASVGYLVGTLILYLLQMLGFATSWLWPIRITEPVVVLVAAFTVRFHLRLADPRHWHTLRVGVVVVAALAMVVPVAQLWISHQRLTDVQTHYSLHHPAFRLAPPIPLAEVSTSLAVLKRKVDKARKREDTDEGAEFAGYLPEE